jgi:S1-C subfamily serine protease
MIIDGVRDDSPASRAGLKGGDKIIGLAGKDIKNVQDYTKLLGEMKADIEYDIVVVRGTDTIRLKIVPVKR